MPLRDKQLLKKDNTPLSHVINSHAHFVLMSGTLSHLPVHNSESLLCNCSTRSAHCHCAFEWNTEETLMCFSLLLILESFMMMFSFFAWQ